jgi:hypothetical protein
LCVVLIPAIGLLILLFLLALPSEPNVDSGHYPQQSSSH